LEVAYLLVKILHPSREHRILLTDAILHLILLACITTILFVKEDVGNRRIKARVSYQSGFLYTETIIFNKALKF